MSGVSRLVVRLETALMNREALLCP
jgi:hypothetical protein